MLIAIYYFVALLRYTPVEVLKFGKVRRSLVNYVTVSSANVCSAEVAGHQEYTSL